MFRNRQVLFCAAALSFLLIQSCSKQNEDGGTPGSGNTFSTTNSVIGSGNSGSGAAGSTVPGEPGSPTDPNLVGTTLTLSKAQEDAIAQIACAGEAREPESVPAKLQLVVDVSSSMGNAAPGVRNATKWEVTRDALVEAICGVTGPGLGAGTSVGLMFYPNMRNTTVSRTPVTDLRCINTQGVTPMDVLGADAPGTHRTLLRTDLTTAVLGLGTPTADAYDYALNNIVLTPAQQSIPGDSYILLITDGIPTLFHGCYNPSGSLSDLNGEEVVTWVDTGFNNQVKTFIIGSPGSESMRSWLSKAAFLGGTAKVGCSPDSATGPYCHMDMTAAPDFSVALRDGLSQVMLAISQCKYDVPAESPVTGAAVDPNNISPIINFGNGSTELVTRDNANGESCTEGFRLISPTQMQLCSATCARFQADANATLQLLFGCQDEVTTTVTVIQ